MLNFLNGYISKKILPNETVLRIILSEQEGQELQPVFPEILKGYSKYITCLEFCGGENNMLEIESMVKTAKKSGLRTSWSTAIKDETQISKNLNDELDYLCINSNYMKKDYSPFGDEMLWINI